jgi:hypothetical protein
MIRRMWINAPSKSNIYHKLHGMRVLVDTANTYYKLDRVHTLANTNNIPSSHSHCWKCYFLSGPVISQYIIIKFLSDGWPDDK